MDGISATRIIRGEMELTIPIVILSAETGDALKLAVEAGANCALSKPVILDDLVTAMNKILFHILQ